MRSEKLPLVKIGKLCGFSNGHGFTPTDWKTIGFPIIRIQNLNGSQDFNYYQGEPKKEWVVNPGDLLFAWAGVKGVSFGPTIWKGPIGVLNQHIYRIHPLPGVDKRWLYYALAQVTFEIEKKAHGFKTSLVHVRKSDISNASVAKASLQEQSKLVDMLSTWDLAIDETEWLIAAKEQRYSWLSCMLLFGNINSNSDASKRTRWFAVPDHWKIVKIGSVAKEIKATNGSGESIPVLSCTKYDGLVNSLEYFGKQVFSLDTSTYKVVSRGEFAYATNHIEEGSIGYQNLHDKGLVSPMYTVFETDKSIDDGYLYKVLKTETYRHIFQVNTSASVDRRGSLRWNEFAKLPIPLPPIDEQQKISATLNIARQEIDLLKKQAEAYRRQKRGLMQKLLTGEWRVRVG